MKSRITKIAAAAVIVIAVLFGSHYFSGSIDPASVAWADVARRIARVDHVHYIIFPVIGPDGSLADYREDYQHGWYRHGNTVQRLYSGCMYYDNGRTRQYFDRNKTRIGKPRPSRMKDRTFFSYITNGLLAEDNERLTQQTPVRVGDDFLIYKFETPNHVKWKNVLITVGRNSLLPVQMKVNVKEPEGAYGLLIFDYTDPAKPAEFFEPPTTSKRPHGRGEVPLNGDETTIDIFDAPGIKALVVRLYRPGSEIELSFWADVSFILEEGSKSLTIQRLSLNLNEGKQLFMGRAKYWPDKMYRDMSTTLLLKPTENEDTYIIEVSCWFDTIRTGDLG